MTVYASLRQLWLGQLPLGQAFWRYLITYDLILNLAATFTALSLVLTEAPISLAAIIHFLPLPYSLLAGIGAWRSADRFEGSPNLANAAKLSIVIWIGIWLFL